MPAIKMQGADVDIQQSGSGRDLLLLHSLLADRSTFDRVVPDLSKKRRVWAVNLPGYGASSAAGGNIEDHADHIADLLRALGLTRKTDVLGNSLGGFIAAALASRHGEVFERLVVANSVPAFPAAVKEPLRAMAERVQQQGMSAVLDAAIRRMFPEPFMGSPIAASRSSGRQGICISSSEDPFPSRTAQASSGIPRGHAWLHNSGEHGSEVAAGSCAHARFLALEGTLSATT